MAANPGAFAVAGAAALALLAGCSDPKSDLKGHWSGTGFEAGSDRTYRLSVTVREAKYKDDDFVRLTVDGAGIEAHRFDVSDRGRVRAWFDHATGNAKLKAETHDEEDELRGWLRITDEDGVRAIQFRLKGGGKSTFVFSEVPPTAPPPQPARDPDTATEPAPEVPLSVEVAVSFGETAALEAQEGDAR